MVRVRVSHNHSPTRTPCLLALGTLALTRLQPLEALGTLALTRLSTLSSTLGSLAPEANSLPMLGLG